MLFWSLAACALTWCTVQATYDVIFEDVDCSQVNEEYISTCELELDYDSTYGASMSTYIEVIKDFPPDVNIIADVFTVRMGEYTVDVGLHVEVNLCEVAEDPNSIAVPILRAVDMNGPCPPTARTYQLDEYVIDNMDGLPPTFPSGHYLINMTFYTGDTTIVHFDVYIRVY
ncbi:PREDICTED: uncharacterized protein LOC108549246 [Eufriesea mexicana]|uniref:uncharacterized protein LOC108549246 n=1 Tax=Eufriesea mexicana TaxID=516756 RepID=UPI00083C0B69|nr:PREDICTED: uncharacterized protein LOC108549246 [Eufriesea mexicana]